MIKDFICGECWQNHADCDCEERRKEATVPDGLRSFVHFMLAAFSMILIFAGVGYIEVDMLFGALISVTGLVLLNGLVVWMGLTR